MMNAKVNKGATVNNNIVTVKVPVGIPASGKSTWAAAQVAEEGCVIHSSDAIRAELKLGYAKEDHQKVFQEMRDRTIASLKKGESVVYDATNISEWARSEVYKTVKAVRRITGIQVEIELYYFDTPVDICIERNSHREGAACVPVDCINRMAANIVPPTEEELLKNGVSDIAIIETVKYEKEDKTMVAKVIGTVKNVAGVVADKAKEGTIMGAQKVAGVAKKVADVVAKEDKTMETKKTEVKNVTVDEKMTKAQLADELRKTGIDLGASVVKNIKKAELIAMLKHELEAIAAEEAKEIVKPGDGLMAQSTKFAKVVAKNLGVDVSEETVVVGDMTTDKKPVNSTEMGDKEAVDKISINEKVLIQGLVNVWVYQTVNKWNGWKSLFFKSTRGDYVGKYIASSKSLTRVTGDVITKLLGEQENNLDNIHDTWTRVAKAGMCSYDGKFVSIDTDQWALCVKNYNAIQAATKAAGKASVSEYLIGYLK